MKPSSIVRLVILAIAGMSTLIAMWSLPGGREITFEECVLGLLFGILAVLVINRGER